MNPVVFNLSVITEPLKYFRVCHGTPLTKIRKHELLVRKSNISLLDTSTNEHLLQKLKSKKFNDSVILAFVECSCYIQNEPVSQICVIPFSNFGSWITFGPLRIRCLLHLNYIAHYRPHLRCCFYFASHEKICYFASLGSVLLKLSWFVSPFQKLSILVAPCSSIGFCSITAELFRALLVATGEPLHGPQGAAKVPFDKPWLAWLNSKKLGFTLFLLYSHKAEQQR